MWAGLRAVITEVVVSRRLGELSGDGARRSVERRIRRVVGRIAGLRPSSVYFTDFAVR